MRTNRFVVPLSVALVGVAPAMAFAGGLAARASGADPASDVEVQSYPERREVVVTVASVHVPESTPYAHHPSEERLAFRWPATGWVHGYRIDLLDSAGRSLPREMIHHAGVANLERRQLPYPLVERLFAVGRETTPVMLPESMGVPMRSGQELLLYYALVNETDVPVHDAALRITVTWTPEDKGSPRDTFPIYMDANPAETGGTRAFDIPPGLSATSAEFTLPMGGWLRAAGAHLHDYAVEIRLEDVVSGKVLVRLKTRRHPDGRLVSVRTTRFFFKRRGLRLGANRQYRVVGIYDNPTGKVIPHGAMAFMAGPFFPDDAGRWPTIDTADPTYRRDLADILGRSDLAHGEHAQPDVVGR